MQLTKQEVFELCRKQCKDNFHVFWWEFTEEELFEFVEQIEQKTMQSLVEITKEQNLILADNTPPKEEKYFKWAKLNRALREKIAYYEI